MHRLSDRLAWTAEVVAADRPSYVLEVGCGHGHLLSALCERLPGAAVVGVDRSEVMVSGALEVNAANVRTGRVSIVLGSLHKAELAIGAFDAIVAVNVSDFWMRPEKTLVPARTLLTPGGHLYVVHQAPTDAIREKALHATVEALHEYGFGADAPSTKATRPHRTSCVRAHLVHALDPIG